jgi:hypothetical protein
MTYVKTTAAERKQQVKLRYVHVVDSNKPLSAVRQAMQWVLKVITPAAVARAPLGVEGGDPSMQLGAPKYRPTPGACGTWAPAGSKLARKFSEGRYAKPRGY